MNCLNVKHLLGGSLMNDFLCLLGRRRDKIGLIFSEKLSDWDKFCTSKGNYNRMGSYQRLCKPVILYRHSLAKTFVRQRAGITSSSEELLLLKVLSLDKLYIH